MRLIEKLFNIRISHSSSKVSIKCRFLAVFPEKRGGLGREIEFQSPNQLGGLPERPFDVIEIWRERRNYLKDFSGNTLTKCTALPAHLPERSVAKSRIRLSSQGVCSSHEDRQVCFEVIVGLFAILS